MRIWVLPVSGGFFVNQLGIICELLSKNILIDNSVTYRSCDKNRNNEKSNKPDVILASSGGNVSAYITLAGNWEVQGIERCSRMLNSSLFISSWCPEGLSFIPSWVIGYFRGSLYNSGKGVDELFNTMFTSSLITRTEIWTGTVNQFYNKASIFCNRSKENTLLKTELFNPKAVGSMPLSYLDGNIDDIAQVSVASASIPTLVKGQKIDGEIYVDGGVIFASPLTPMRDVISSSSGSHLHIIYISSFDMENIKTDNKVGNLFQMGQNTLGEMVQSLCIQDRLTAIDIIKRRSRGIVKFISSCEINIDNIIDIEKNSENSLLELFPTGDGIEIDITSFTGEDVVKLIKEARKSYGARLWYS